MGMSTPTIEDAFGYPIASLIRNTFQSYLKNDYLKDIEKLENDKDWPGRVWKFPEIGLWQMNFIINNSEDMNSIIQFFSRRNYRMEFTPEEREDGGVDLYLKPAKKRKITITTELGTTTSEF